MVSFQDAKGESQPVPFEGSPALSAVMTSPHYNPKSRTSYFDQCFSVCEKLGEGSFGEVYQVQSRDDGKMYAIKQSSQPFKGAVDKREKLAEVEKNERLAPHPNCVRFHKAWEEREKLHIQMELCKMRSVFPLAPNLLISDVCFCLACQSTQICMGSYQSGGYGKY